MEGRDGGEGATLVRLVEKATSSVDREVNSRLLKSIKSVVRSSDDNVRVAVGTLMDRMKKDHSQVRYLALLIIDELFMRSKLFRTLFVANFDIFLSLSVGFRRNTPLPPPHAIASLLRSRSIELLEKWNESFGFHYRQVRIGFDYLKNNLKFQFPNRLENESRLQQERRERDRRSREILLNKYEGLKENFSSFKSEIHSTLNGIGECLDMISSGNSEAIERNPIEDDESMEFSSLALRQIRLDSMKEARKTCESNENKAIFDALRELHKLTVSKHLSSIQECLSILVRVDLPDYGFRDSALKELIDIRNVIQAMVRRCEESGYILPCPNEEEDLWEEGKIKLSGVEPPSTSNGTDVGSSNIIASGNDKERVHTGKQISSGKSTEDCELGTSLRSKLLSEAPVLTWGTFMDTWGSNREVLANHRGLEVENHWGRVDPDAVIPVGKIAELAYHVTTYKEAAIETKPCLAPLKKGGLCQRRDLRVCPFHGPIVPRDAEGNPVEKKSEEKGNPVEEKSEEKEPVKFESGGESSRGTSDAEGNPVENSEEKELQKFETGEYSRGILPPVLHDTSDVDHDLLKELASQAVNNVRQRERDSRTLKKAKLAKVREHNETVLREAAMASTSHTIFSGEGEAAVHHDQSCSFKKPTLASMLRKKVTAKDRLSERLLNARVTETTIKRLREGEEGRYREAYPNQW